jgi:ParB-like chromosome segregation protein Spo0J
MKRTLSDLITNNDTKDLVIKNVNIDSIKESPAQARKKFDQKKLEELRDSISKTEYFNHLLFRSLKTINMN